MSSAATNYAVHVTDFWPLSFIICFTQNYCIFEDFLVYVKYRRDSIKTASVVNDKFI